MSRIRGAIAIAAVALFLSGCGQFKSLPTEERYQFINSVKTEVDLPSAGEVLIEQNDKGDGVFSPSVYRAELKGDTTTYSDLKTRVKDLKDVRDCSESKTVLNCSRGQVAINLIQDEADPSKVIFRLTDVYSGRSSK